MASAQAERAARLMDAEIRRLERLGVRSGRAAAARLPGGVLRAWLRGGDPVRAVDDWERATIPILASAMSAGYLQGRLRARTVANRAKRGLSLDQTIRGAADDFGDRLGLSESAVKRLSGYFAAHATQRVVDAGGLIRSKVADAAATAIGEGLSTRAGTAVIREALAASGVTPQNPFLAETLYRTSLQEAYAAARWQANKDPAIDEILWGYEFAATLDDRTTEGCADLDGTRRPKADPLWRLQSPPRHWNCRSQLIEIFFGDDEAVATPVPQVGLPQEGFRINFGEAFNVPLEVAFV